MKTRVQKWGNSLAIRLPVSVVEALQLKDGDEVEVQTVLDRFGLGHGVEHDRRVAGRVPELSQRHA